MRIDNQLFNEILDDIEAYIPKLEAASNSVSAILYKPLTEELVVPLRGRDSYVYLIG